MGVGWGSFGWGSGLWGAAPPEVDDYQTVHGQLLPRGYAWDERAPGGTTDKLHRGLSHEPARVEQRARDLVNETDPLQTVELLDDWERVYGLPELCGNPPTTLQGRQLALYTKMRRRGATNLPRLYTLLDDLGYPDAEITTIADPFTCVSECSDALYGFEGYWSDTIYVIPNTTGENDATLQCLLHGQAHEIVIFSEFSLNGGRLWRFVAETLFDPVSGQTGTPTGTTYDSAGNFRDFERSSAESIAWGSVGNTPGGSSSSGAWIRLESTGVNQTIFAIDDAGALGRVLYVNTSDRLVFLHDGTTQKIREGSTVLSAGIWYHVAYTDNGNDEAASVTLYIDAVAEPSYATSQDGSALVDADDSLSIGQSPGFASDEFDGQIRDGASVWGRDITAAEVAAHMIERPEGWP